MKLSSLKSKKLWKDSASICFAILGLIASLMGIVGISFSDICPDSSWLTRLYLIILLYALLLLLILAAKLLYVRNGITMKVNGITVKIISGDLFKADGWKIIPFNEYFDTTVDDRIIAKSSLNGIFIMNYVENIEELIHSIATDEGSLLTPTLTVDNRFKYPLGRIKRYKDYMLLALTHFNEQNMAHISKIDYEYCLMNMWKEVSRTYANIPINLPLLGSGITRFDDVPQKSNFDLLKCMLCTLKASGENINQSITIILTKKAMQEINIYETKGVI